MGVDQKPRPRNVFEAHLDECKQCRENPFDLCAVGIPLLQAAALGGEKIEWPPLDEEGFPF